MSAFMILFAMSSGVTDPVTTKVESTFPGWKMAQQAKGDLNGDARIDLMVAVHELALEQIRHGRQVDMRVRPHVDAHPRCHPDGPHVVEEDERADHPPRHRRKQSPHHQAPAEVAFAGSDLQVHRERRGGAWRG